MPKIISFAYTTPALVAGRKTATWRDWKAHWAEGFRRGDLIAAWDRSPRVKGSRQVAWVRLTQKPYLQSTAEMPDDDYEAEGFAYLNELWGGKPGPIDVSLEGFQAWRDRAETLWVVRLELVKVL